MKKRLAVCAVFLALIASAGFMTGCGSSNSSGSNGSSNSSGSNDSSNSSGSIDSIVSKIGEISADISLLPPTKSISDISVDQPSINLLSPGESTSNLISFKEYVYNGAGPDAFVNLLSSGDTSGILVWSVSFADDDYLVIEAKATKHLNMTDELTKQFESNVLEFYKSTTDLCPSEGIRPFNLTFSLINDDGTTAASLSLHPNDI